MNLRVKYRKLMEQFNPRIPARRGDYYVGLPSSTSKQIKNVLDIAPESHMALLGCVGSGKTSELISLRNDYSSDKDVICIYIDVSGGNKAPVPFRTILFGLAVESIINLLSTRQDEFKGNGSDYNAINDIAQLIYSGHTKKRSFLEHELRMFRGWNLKTLNPISDEAIPQLVFATKHLKERYIDQDIVLLFDGLDRLSNLGEFFDIIDFDIQQMRSIGVGSVTVAQLPARNWGDGLLRSTMNEVKLHAPFDVVKSSDTYLLDFMKEVISLRDTERVITELARFELIKFSGGILRDLVTLTRGAATEAYRAGSPVVEPAHVKQTALSFGKGLLSSLSDTSTKRLHVMLGANAFNAEFTPTNDLDLQLILQRVIIEYSGDSSLYYRLHPTLERLIK